MRREIEPSAFNSLKRFGSVRPEPRCACQSACSYQTAWSYHADLICSPERNCGQRHQPALDDVNVIDWVAWQAKYVIRLERRSRLRTSAKPGTWL